MSTEVQLQQVQKLGAFLATVDITKNGPLKVRFIFLYHKPIDKIDFFSKGIPEFKVTTVRNIKNNGRKKLLVLGNTGDGKSTLCNILSGFDPMHQSIFPVSAGANSCTQETKFENVFFNGNKENPISLIDTIGWSDSGEMNSAKIIEELITKLKDACDHISLFVLASKSRLTYFPISFFIDISTQLSFKSVSNRQF